MFYGILNIAFVNSYVIYCHNVREYMKTLSTPLITPWMSKRLEAPTLPRHVRENIENILPKPAVHAPTDDDEEPPAKIRRYCGYSKFKKKESQR